MPSLLKMMAEMGLNIGPFQKGLDQAKQSATTQGGEIGRAFQNTISRFFGAAALTAFAAQTFKRIADIKDLADQFRLTTDEVQTFGRAFEESGLDAESAFASIDRLNKARREAVEGNEDLRESFKVFGISVAQLNDASIETKDLWLQIGRALQQTGDGIKERAAMMDIMGKSSARFAEAMKNLESVQTPLVPREQVEEIDRAEKHLRSLRRELEAYITVRTSKALKGDAKGALEEDLDALNKVGVKHPALELIGLIREAFSKFESKDFEFAEGKRPGKINFQKLKEAQAIAGQPQKVDLFKDGILAEQRLKTGKAQAEVEKSLSDIVFDKLSREQQVGFLRNKQKEAEREIAYQNRMLAKEVDADETRQLKRQEIIAKAKQDQLDAEKKIHDLQRRGGIGFEGYMALLQAGGSKPGVIAAAEKIGNPAVDQFGKQTVSILGEIEKKLGDRRVILGR